MTTVDEGTVVGEEIIGLIPDTQDRNYAYVVLGSGESFRVWTHQQIRSKEETENVLRTAQRYLASADSCMSVLLGVYERERTEANKCAEQREECQAGMERNA